MIIIIVNYLLSISDTFRIRKYSAQSEWTLRCITLQINSKDYGYLCKGGYGFAH